MPNTSHTVTLSEFVADSADKRVEIFAGQIFDLAFAKTAKPKDFAGYSRPWHYLHTALLELTVLSPWKGYTDSGYTPRHAPQASVFSARLRLDYENFDAPVMDGLAQGDNRGQS